MTRLSSVLSIALLSVGCIENWAPTVRTRASFDFQCPTNQIQVATMDGAYSYAAQGCGKRAAYLIRAGAAILNSGVMDVAAAPRRNEPPQAAPSAGSATSDPSGSATP